MSDSVVSIFCECDSQDCNRTVDVPLSEAVRIKAQSLIPIVDGCPCGPSSKEILAEEHPGYALYVYANVS